MSLFNCCIYFVFLYRLALLIEFFYFSGMIIIKHTILHFLWIILWNWNINGAKGTFI